MKHMLLTTFGLVLFTGLGFAEPLWIFNFNGEGQGPAPDTIHPSDSAEASLTGRLVVAENWEEGRAFIVESDGPEGGLALELRPGGVQNGTGYLTFRRGHNLESSEITYEVLIKPAEISEPHNESYGGQQILNQQPGGSCPQLMLSYQNGEVRFGGVAGSRRLSGLVHPGRWTHVAAVCVLSADQSGDGHAKLYINGELVDEDSIRQPPGKFQEALGIGRYMQDGKGDSFQGQIDAIAVSGEALDPSTFALPRP
jgi:hypothetical protein